MERIALKQSTCNTSGDCRYFECLARISFTESSVEDGLNEGGGWREWSSEEGGETNS